MTWPVQLKEGGERLPAFWEDEHSWHIKRGVPIGMRGIVEHCSDHCNSHVTSEHLQD